MTKNHKQFKEFSGEAEAKKEIKKVNDLVKKALEDLGTLKGFYNGDKKSEDLNKLENIKSEDPNISYNLEDLNKFYNLEKLNKLYNLLDGCSKKLLKMQNQRGLYKNNLNQDLDNINKEVKKIESIPMNDFGYALLDASKSVNNFVEKFSNLLSRIPYQPIEGLVSFWQQKDSDHVGNQKKLSDKEIKHPSGTKLSDDKSHLRK